MRACVVGCPACALAAAGEFVIWGSLGFCCEESPDEVEDPNTLLGPKRASASRLLLTAATAAQGRRGQAFAAERGAWRLTPARSWPKDRPGAARAWRACRWLREGGGGGGGCGRCVCECTRHLNHLGTSTPRSLRVRLGVLRNLATPCACALARQLTNQRGETHAEVSSRA